MKNKKQKGFAFLLELIFTFALIATLMAMSSVNLLQIRAARNQNDAVIRLREVRQAQAALTICANTPTCVPSAALQNLIPVDGSVLSTGGYTFSYSWNSGYWFMSASPVSSPMTGIQFLYIDYSGQMRASTAGPANATSAPW